MKLYKTALLALLLFTTAVNAEEITEKKDEPQKQEQKQEQETETLFKSDNLSFSGYGAPVVKYSRIGEANSCLVGGKGGLIINNNFVIGVSGYGLAYPTKRDKISGDTYSGTEPYIGFGYGGGMLEYYFAPKKLIHFSLGVLIGAGGMNFHSDKDDNGNNNSESGADAFFVVEPEANIYFNVTKFLRVGLGVSYRHTNGITSGNFEDNDFSGANGSLTFAFGWF